MKNHKYPSFFQIGERVKLKTQEIDTDKAYVRAITFTTGKVRYAIFLGKSKTTLHNVDSAFIFPRKGKKQVMEFKFDNYS